MALTKISRSLLDTGVSDSSDATAITIDSSERVGIGTSTLHKNLNIHTSDSNSTNIVFTNSTTGTGSSDGFYVGIDSNESPEFWNYENTDFIVGLNNSEKFRIKADGNVGINTSSPNEKLEVAGNLTLTPSSKSNSPSASATISDINFVGRTDNTVVAKIRAIHNDNANGTDGQLTFFTADNTASAAAAERMRIDSTGRVGINTSSPTATYKLSIASAANHGAFVYDIGSGYGALVTKPDSSNNYFPLYILNNSGAANGYILSNSSGTAFSQSGSDIFFKENIKDWNENVLDSFKNIKPSTFTYKSDENKKEIKGYIAQNEFDKFPEAYPINPRDDKHWFNPSGMTVYLMKAIQELSAKVEELENKINE